MDDKRHALLVGLEPRSTTSEGSTRADEVGSMGLRDPLNHVRGQIFVLEETNTSSSSSASATTLPDSSIATHLPRYRSTKSRLMTLTLPEPLRPFVVEIS